MRKSGQTRYLIFSLLILLTPLLPLGDAASSAFTPPANGTVTFYENAYAGDTVTSFETATSTDQLTKFANLSPAFVDPGYSFLNWNTSSSGTGASYPDNGSYNFSSNLVLYAIWEPVPIETADFVANGGTGTVAPISSAENSLVDTPTSAGITNPGYTFIGWNTAANGTGTEYAVGAPYTLTGDQTLYAQWQADVYSVSFATDGGTPTIATVSYTYATPGFVLPTVSQTNDVFDGWWTATSGGTLAGLAGATYVPASSIELYAQWSPATVLVTFNAESGTATSSSATYTEGTSGLILPTDVLTGSVFNGWYSAVSGGTLIGVAGATYVPTSPITLFAQFSALPTDTVSFDANGGSGAVASISGVQGSTVSLPDETGLILPGYELSSWNTQANGSGATVAVGGTLQVSTSTVLYAQWVNPDPRQLIGSVGSFAKNSSTLTPALKKQIVTMAMSVKTKKLKKVLLYGYTAPTGLVSLNISLSSARAKAVATFLKAELTALKVTGVSYSSAGEGAIAGETSTMYSRVEVFAQ